jgi:hypothetical protein
MMVAREMGHTQMSGRKRSVILLSMHSLWRLLKRSGFDKVILTKHLVWNGFTVDYETWVFQGEK